MSSPLTAEQLAQLPAEIQDSLQKYFSDKSAREDELQTSYERFRIDAEQKYFELERLQLLDRNRLEIETKSASDLRHQINELEKKYSETAEKYRELQTRHFEKVAHLTERDQTLQAAKSRLETDNADLSELLQKRNREVDQLSDEWKQLTDRLNDATKARIAAQNEVGEVKSELVIVQHRESRLKNELESLRQQNEWLSKELQERTNELMAGRKEKSLKTMELQGQLDDAQLESAQSQRSLETQKKLNSDLTEQIEQYIVKLKDARDGNTRLEEQYRQELLAQEKLLELYKVATAEAEEKASELTKAVAELQKLLKQASQVYDELQAEREEDNRVSRELISERDTRISSLEKELSNANELLEVSRCHERQLTCQDDAEILSSAAANVSRLLKSGMTLTQICSEYVQACSSLQTQTEENKRLSDYLDRILQEIEEKAPLMKKQRQDYEKCIETIAQLTHQLDTAMMECEQCRISSENDRRRCAELTRENGRQKQLTADLSQQVRMLLKELEEARGTVVHMNPDVELSSAYVSSSSVIISDRLVTFRSIEELQEQNQKLLAVVRELSDAQEQRETETIDSKSAELQRQLEDASKEIEEMKDARRRQMEMVESIVQQRDMYRMLATQPAASPKRTPVQSTSMAPAVSSPAPGVPVTPARIQLSEQDVTSLNETKKSLKELQEEFSIYRREKGENEKIINEQLEKANKETSTLRLQNARLAAQLEFTGERTKVLTSNCESHQKELEALRNKNTKLIAALGQHQQTLSTLQESLLSTQDKLTRAEVRCQNLASEKEIIKNSEARLSMEIEMLHRNQQSRDQLVISLEAIQNNLERAEFETRTRLGQQIERYERENAILRKKLDGTDDQQKAFVTTLERQLSEARQDVERERAQAARTQEQLSTAQEHIQFLKQEMSNVESRLKATQSKLASTLESRQDDDSDKRLEDEVKRFRDLADNANRQISNLECQLAQAEQHAAQYKTIADTVEHSLREQNEASLQLRETLEAQINETVRANESLQEQVQKLESTVAELSTANDALADENAALREQQSKRLAEARSSDAAASGQLAELQRKLTDTSEQLDGALSNERIAREDCLRQAGEAKLAQQNYERELVLHAADVESLSQAKREMEQFNEKLEEARADAREARSILSASQASWVEQEQSLRTEMEKLREKLSDFQAQNTTLHQELEKMSTQMLQLQSRDVREQEQLQRAAENIDTTSETSSSEQLLEVIRFLRREKELAEARFELIQAETNRLRQQTSMLKKQADAAENALSEEREKAQVSLQTAAEHAEMMHKVETLNLLQESNHMLRDERNRLAAQLKDVETKARRLEDQLRPLEEKCHDMTAQRDSAQKEIEILQAEIERWKSRTNHLIEQCNKFDPEEHKRAIDEREQAKKQLSVLSEESHKQRAESSRLNALLRTAQSECEQLRQQITTLSTELAEARSSVERNEADSEEKNKTILQLRKLGRKYRTQAEEVQKELDDLKAKNAAEHESSQSDTVALRDRVVALEQERDSLTTRHTSTEHDKQEALKRVKQLEQRQQELNEQIARLNEDHGRLTSENASLTAEQQKTVAERQKEGEDRARLQAENTSALEDKRKLLATLQTAKQRLVTLRNDKEKLESTCTDLRQQLEVARVDSNVPRTEPSADEQLTAVRAEMQTTVSRLETEVAELQQSRSTLQHDSLQQLESLERLRRENAELLQRVHALQSQLEMSTSKQTGPSPAKPTISAPPVERAATAGASTDQQQAPPRKANIRPMASQQQQQQLHVRTVQPVRSSVTETRAMASIRPMAAAMMSSTSSTSTPMATVMPTTATMSEVEGTSSCIVSAATLQSQMSAQQQGRPTQQVQPVSSHFEEATVSSSEEQPGAQLLEMMQSTSTASWWHMDATPSTSSERDGPNHGNAATGGAGKRIRDDTRPQEEGSTDNETEAPTKRPKTSAEVADTTETTNASAPATMDIDRPTVAESEREAASVAQLDASATTSESSATVRRETEPVTTSLSAAEDRSRTFDAAQDEDASRAANIDQTGDNRAASAELPDYQDAGEMAAVDYDVRPSTSRQGNEAPVYDDGQEDSREAGGVGGHEYQREEESEDGVEGGNEEQQDDDDDDDVILVEDEDVDAEMGVGEGGEDYQENSGDEAERRQDVGEEEYEGEEGDEDYEAGAERSNIPYEAEGYEGEEISQGGGNDEDEDGNDDVELVRGHEGDSSGLEVEAQARDEDVASTVTTSVPLPQHSTSRHLVATHVVASMPTTTSSRHDPIIIAPSSSTVFQSLNVRQPVPSQPMSSGAMRLRPRQAEQVQLATANRAQLMPFIFGQGEVGSGYEFENDSIVPSTPTLMIPQRSDGFAEAVCSPQVRDDRFMFIAASGDTSHSQLAHQEGVGVDDTRMELFDEAAAAASRSLVSTPQSPLMHPEIFVTGGEEEVEQLTEPAEGAVSSEYEHELEQNVGYFDEGLMSAEGSASNSRAQSPIDLSAADDETHGEVTAADQSKQSTSAGGQEEQPSTSSSGQTDRTAAERHEASHGQNKPKIQRIVWEEGRGTVGPPRRDVANAAAQQSSGASTAMSGFPPSLMSLSPGDPPVIATHQRRGVTRGRYQQVGPRYHSAGQLRPRPAVQHQSPGGLLVVTRVQQPGNPQGNPLGQRHPQVARRARSGPGPRSFF